MYFYYYISYFHVLHHARVRDVFFSHSNSRIYSITEITKCKNII